MPKGYLIELLSIDKPELFTKYRSTFQELQNKYNGQRLVGGPSKVIYENNPLEGYNTVIIEFPDTESAYNYFHDPKHKEIEDELRANNFGDAKIRILEGLRP